MTIKFRFNGVQEDGMKLVRCWYWLNNDGSLGISARDYKSFGPEMRAAFKVRNESDLMTDYFDNDRVTVAPEHPLYKAALAGYAAWQAHRAKVSAKREARWAVAKVAA